MTSLIEIGSLAIKVHIMDESRENARKIRNRMMYDNPCTNKNKVYNGDSPCFTLTYLLHSNGVWCDNCKKNQPYHDEYIKKAHQVSALKAKLNKAIKEYTEK